MKLYRVDARGLSCPQPVIDTRKALKTRPDRIIEVLVDNDAAVENVSRTARSLDCEVGLESLDGGAFCLRIKKPDGFEAEPSTKGDEEVSSCYLVPKIVVLLASDKIGTGDDALGKKLMNVFADVAGQFSPRPTTIAFVNSGINLVMKDSEVTDAFAELEKQGVELLVCSVCLDHFKLMDKLAVGKVSNMFDIGLRMMEADRVIRF